MNAIQVVGNYVQMTATNKTILIVVVAILCVVCVYKLVTSERWLSMLVGVLLLVAAVVSLSGCSIEHDRLATQRAQAQSAAVIEQAKSDQRIAESEASVENYKTLATAAKPDNSVLLVVLVGFIALAILVVYKLFEVNMWQAQTMREEKQTQPVLLPSPQGSMAWLLPDGTVYVERKRDGKGMYLESGDPMYQRLIATKGE